MRFLVTLVMWAALAAPVSAKTYNDVAETCRAVEAINGGKYHCWSKEREKEGLAYWACRLRAALKGDSKAKRCWRVLR